jgi:hypothetical protein
MVAPADRAVEAPEAPGLGAGGVVEPMSAGRLPLDPVHAPRGATTVHEPTTGGVLTPFTS